MIHPQKVAFLNQRGHVPNDPVVALEGWVDTTTVGGVR